MRSGSARLHPVRDPGKSDDRRVGLSPVCECRSPGCLHAPIFALDVFDMEVPLPKVLMENVKDVVSDPAEWARMNVKKYNADMITVPPYVNRPAYP